MERFKHSVNSWPDFEPFKKFLKGLENLGIVDALKQGIQCSGLIGKLNFYSPAPIESNFVYWFVYNYNTRTYAFSQVIGTILKEIDALALCNYITISPYAPIFFEHSWDKLLDELQDLSWNDWNAWVAASTHMVPGCGILVKNSGTKLWLQILSNQYPEHLKLVGKVLRCNQQETCRIVSTIQRYGFSDAFGLNDTPQAPGPLLIPTLEVLNPALIGKNDSEYDKALAVESVFTDPTINKIVQEKLPALFPNGVTLSQLAKQGTLWKNLCIGLVVFVEREHFKRRETFSVGDLRTYIEKTITELIAYLPVIDLLKHDPTQTIGIRKNQWISSTAAQILNKPTLLNLLGKPEDLNHRHSTQEEMNRWIDQLLELANQNPTVRQNLLALAGPTCIVGAISEITKKLFSPVSVPVGQLEFKSDDFYNTLVARKIPEEIVGRLIEAQIDSLEIFLEMNESNIRAVFPDVPEGILIRLRLAQSALNK